MIGSRSAANALFVSPTARSRATVLAAINEEALEVHQPRRRVDFDAVECARVRH